MRDATLLANLGDERMTHLDTTDGRLGEGPAGRRVRLRSTALLAASAVVAALVVAPGDVGAEPVSEPAPPSEPTIRPIGAPELPSEPVVPSTGSDVVSPEPAPGDLDVISSALTDPQPVDFTSESFGRFQYQGDYRFATPIPGTTEVLTIDDASMRLARLDLETFTIRRGAVVPRLASGPADRSDVVQLLVTSDGSTGWMVRNRSGGDRIRIDRVDVADLTVSDSTSVPKDADDVVAGYEDRVVAATVPDRTETLVVVNAGMVSGTLAVVSEGRVTARFSSADLTSAFESDLAMLDSMNGVARLGGDNDVPGQFVADEILPFEIGTDGMLTTSDPVPIGEGGLRARLGGVLLSPLQFGPTTFHTLPDFEGRAATDFERGRVDAFGEFVYTSTVDASGSGGNRTIFDAQTRAVVTSGTRCVTTSGVDIAGDGYEVGFRSRGGGSGPIEATFLPWTCGAKGEFTPVDPDRLLDTRTGEGTGGRVARLRGGTTSRVQVAGLAGVPATGIDGVVLNVTAVDQRNAPTGANFLTVHPAGTPRPEVANVNLFNGTTVGNQVTVATSRDGFVDIYSDSGDVDLVVDVMGYFSTGLAPRADRYRPIDSDRRASARLVDTRTRGRLAAGETMTVTTGPDVVPDGVSPADVTAVVVNVTAVNPDLGGHFRIFPTGTALPDASSMNFPTAVNTNRLVTVKVDGRNRFEIYNGAGTTDVTVDVVGVYHSSSAEIGDGRFFGFGQPVRISDTRTDSPFPETGGRIPPGNGIIFSGNGSPDTIVANLAAIRSDARGYLDAGPDGFGLGARSALNFEPGNIVGNQALIEVSPSSGDFVVVNSAGFTHVTLDVFGIYLAD